MANDYRPSKRALVVIGAGVVCIFLVSCFFTVRKHRDGFQQAIAFWGDEISVALVKNDKTTLNKISSLLYTAGFQRLFIENKASEVVISYPAEIDAKSCDVVFKHEVLRYSQYLGTIQGCYSYFFVFTRTMTSSFFIVIAVIFLFAAVLIQFQKIFVAVKNNERLYRSELLSKLAAQVAHDIRSPLAALENVIAGTKELPEDDRVLVRTAVNRIKDIANNLIEKNRELKVAKPGGEQNIESVMTQLLSSLIDPLITEKRMQFRSKIGVEIIAELDAASYGLFARVQPIEFKRVLSNLINNAVESLGDKGRVSLGLFGKSGQIEIRITDNGKGIADDILQRLGERGETHGKVGGSGLGLYHARTSVQSWGGKLAIESKLGAGTSVLISLPQVAAPNWFVAELKLVPQGAVVVLDDDSSIHGIWQGRFDSLRVTEKAVRVFHFSTPQELQNWVSLEPVAAKTALYLADYELLGHRETGLSLIESLNLGSRAVLVTSRFEEEHVRAGCERLGVRLIPKSMAGFVPISFAQKLERPDCILIDDDILLIHPIWRSAAKSKGLNIKLFSTPHEFLSVVDTIDRLTPIYIDVSLGNGVKGTDFAVELHKLGFTEINLATGYEPDSIQAPPFIRRIVGKDFPELS